MNYIHCLKKVQDLFLGNYSRSSRPLLTAYEHRVITDWMNNLDLGLKPLTIVNYPLTNLPLLSSLESLILVRVNIDSPIILNIPSYRCLRYLKLSSVSIEDVSSLDRIYELYLEYCNHIRDISCLNHNHKIVISDCESIVDYSKSFRYSKIIDISCPLGFTQEATEGFDLSKAVEAREIYVRGGDCNNKQLLLPHCLSLRVVQAWLLPRSFALPSEHLIQEVIVRNCPAFQSFLHFGCMCSVKLVGLSIFTLIGLGSGNRVVEVDSCPAITDFTLLRHCDKVTINNCEGFLDQVRGVKYFIFTPVNVDNLPHDMEGVTCLILENIPYHLLSLQFPSTLKKLIIGSSDSVVDDYLIKQLPLLLASLPRHIGKIEVFVDEKYMGSLLVTGELSFPDFIIEFKEEREEAHFLRKNPSPSI